MPVYSSSSSLASALTKGWAATTRKLKAIGAGVLIVALAVSGAQFAAISATAAGAVQPTVSGEGSISGSVVDAFDETYLDGITVVAYLWDEALQEGQEVASVTTVDGGAFSLGGLADGVYRLGFFSPQGAQTPYVASYWEYADTIVDGNDLVITDGAAIDAINAMLWKDTTAGVTYSVSGLVTNSADSNLKDIIVSALAWDEAYSDYATVATSTTNSAGLYALPGLASGSYIIKFESPSTAATRYQSSYYLSSSTIADAVAVDVQATDVSDINAVLNPANSISGAVKDTASGRVAAKALTGIVVRAQVQRYDAEWDYIYYETVSETTTSGTGAFSLGGLNDGDYIIQYSSAEDAPTQYLTEYYSNISNAEEAWETSLVSVSGGEVVPVSLTNLALSASIRGTLTTAVDGAALASNDVYVNACKTELSGWLDCSYGRTVIASDGGYTLTDLTAGTYAVRVDYYGSENLLGEYYSTTTTTAWADADASFVVLAAGATATGKNVALNAGAEISGTVTKDGSPVVGNTVTAYEENGGSLQETRAAVTDVDGNYTINRLPQGKYSVATGSQWNGGGYSENRAPRLALTVTATTHSTETADFALVAGGSISGNVVDRTGLVGVNQATVTATRYDSATSNKANELTFTELTTPQGQYSFLDLAPGYYGISYANNGYLTTQYVSSEAPTDRVLVVAGQASPSLPDVVLHTSATVTGRVIDASGNPLAEVIISDNADWWNRTTQTFTDNDGNYTLEGLDPAVGYTLHFDTSTLDGMGDLTYADTTVALPVGALTLDGQAVALGDTVLAQTAAVTGKVTDSAGVGQVGMTIEALVKSGNSGYNLVSSTTTTLGGAYSLTDVPAGAILHFASDDFAPASTAKFASQYDGGTTNPSLATVLNFSTPGAGIRHDMVLVPIGSITGTVKKGTAVLAGIRVSAYSVDPDHSNVWTSYGEGVTNARGVYTIPGLAQGSYTVSFNNRASGSSVTGLPTTVGQTTATANVPWNASVTSNAVLIPTAKVTGTVTGPASSKLAGIAVTAYPWSGTTAGEPTQGDGFDVTTTDSLGNYTLILTPGKYVLKFADDQGRVSTRYLGGTSAPVDANKITVAATALTAKNITLVSTGATLTANVINLDGDLAEGWIELERLNGDVVTTSVITSTWNQQIINDAFPLKNIEAGNYRLTINSSNGSDLNLVVTFTVVGNAVTTYTIGSNEPVADSSDLGTINFTQTSWVYAEPTVIAGSEPTISVVGESNAIVVGSVLQTNNDVSAWVNVSSADNFGYQWLRDGRAIAAATGEQYQITPGDAGTAISLRVIAELWWDYTTPATSIVEIGSLEAGELPVISGSRNANNAVSAGKILTATPGSYSVDGLNYRYEWLRNETPITGAVASTYKLTVADVGTIIQVSVTAKRAGYADDTLVSEGFEGIVPATVLRQTKALAPTLAAGVYTARPGTWTPAGATFTYEWLSFGAESTPIDSAQGTTFAAPSDPTLKVVLRITASKAGYASTTVERVVRAGTGLTITDTPTVEGSGTVGSPLSVQPTSNHANATFTYQWYRATAVIAGATKASYEPIATDVGRVLSVKITAKNAGFANSVAVTAIAPTITAASSGSASDDAIVTGTYAVGRALSVSTGMWSPTPTSFSYKWLRAASAEGTYVAISRATAAKYTLVAADLGKFIKAVVTPVRKGFSYPVFTSSANQSAIGAQEVTNLTAPSIGAVAKVGTALTANAGTWDIAGATFTYQWLVNGRIIPGATAASYTPSPETLADELSVRVWANKATFPSGAESEIYSNSLTVTKGAALVATTVPTIKVGASRTVATTSTVIALGQTLGATSGVWPTGARSVDYQWQHIGPDSDSSWTNIPGANSDSLVIDENSQYMIDEYKYRLVVTVRRAGYVDATAVSVALRLNIP